MRKFLAPSSRHCRIPLRSSSVRPRRPRPTVDLLVFARAPCVDARFNPSNERAPAPTTEAQTLHSPPESFASSDSHPPSERVPRTSKAAPWRNGWPLPKASLETGGVRERKHQKKARTDDIRGATLDNSQGPFSLRTRLLSVDALGTLDCSATGHGSARYRDVISSLSPSPRERAPFSKPSAAAKPLRYDFPRLLCCLPLLHTLPAASFNAFLYSRLSMSMLAVVAPPSPPSPHRLYPVWFDRLRAKAVPATSLHTQQSRIRIVTFIGAEPGLLVGRAGVIATGVIATGGRSRARPSPIPSPFPSLCLLPSFE
ncbi:hypothetical protein RJ55_05558 [Drechmeria coniospora]|nr:hypothetical protein RJ55_05558 [Drechmeria coniospora]